MAHYISCVELFDRTISTRVFCCCVVGRIVVCTDWFISFDATTKSLSTVKAFNWLTGAMAHEEQYHCTRRASEHLISQRTTNATPHFSISMSMSFCVDTTKASTRNTIKSTLCLCAFGVVTNNQSRYRSSPFVRLDGVHDIYNSVRDSFVLAASERGAIAD